MKTSLKHRNLPSLLLQARESIMAHTRPFLRAHGLSDQQWRVLRVLGSGQSFETGRVAKEAFLLGPSLTGVLTRMERDGLVVELLFLGGDGDRLAGGGDGAVEVAAECQDLADGDGPADVARAPLALPAEEREEVVGLPGAHGA